MRTNELEGQVRDAFLGDRRGVDLAPEWTERRFAAASSNVAAGFCSKFWRRTCSRGPAVFLSVRHAFAMAGCGFRPD